MSAIRMLASGGDCHPSSRMAKGETINRHSAKSAYEGAIAALKSAQCAIELSPASEASHCQPSTTGAADTPHTMV